MVPAFGRSHKLEDYISLEDHIIITYFPLIIAPLTHLPSAMYKKDVEMAEDHLLRKV